MVAYQNNMLGSFQQRNQGFWLCCLCSFINQHLLEFHRLESLIKSGNTSCAYDICIPHYFIFSLSLQVFVGFIIFFVQFTLFLSQTHQILHSFVRAMFQMLYLFVKWNVVNVWSYWLSWSCAQSNNFQTRVINLFGELIDSNVGRCADKDFT